jgi:hypothetical protein
VDLMVRREPLLKIRNPNKLDEISDQRQKMEVQDDLTKGKQFDRQSL